MTVDEAIRDLARKADPCQARCLKCCAVLRRTLVGLSGLRELGTGFDLTVDEVQAEVDRILADHPDLAGRFQASGLPIGVECGEATEASRTMGGPG